MQFGVGSGGLSASNFENQYRSGGLFRSSRRRTLTSDLDPEVAAEFDQLFGNINDTVINGLQVLGFDIAENALDAFRSGTRQIEFGEDEAANQAAVQAYFETLSDDILNILSSYFF